MGINAPLNARQADPRAWRWFILSSSLQAPKAAPGAVWIDTDVPGSASLARHPIGDASETAIAGTTAP